MSFGVNVAYFCFVFFFLFLLRYQLELCKKAMEENIIVYLGTGCGKTHIAVLLINELAYLIRKPQKSICIFLAPTVALVQQVSIFLLYTLYFLIQFCVTFRC